MKVRRGSLNSSILLNDQTILKDSYLKPTDAIWVVHCGSSKAFHVAVFSGPVESLTSQSIPSIQEVYGRFGTSRFDTNWSRCETSSKSIRYMWRVDLIQLNLQARSRGKAAEGRAPPPPPQKFSDLIWIPRLLKWKAVNGSHSFQVLPIIVSLRTVVVLYNLELCKGTKSYFCSAKNDQHL